MEKKDIIKHAYGSRWDAVKDHVDENGWFPDTILGDEIWVLSWCDKEQREDGLYWRMSTLRQLDNMQRDGLRKYTQLLEILIQQAEERGFGAQGICCLIIRLTQKGVFSPCEQIKLEATIYINRPPGVPHNAHYFWPTTEHYTQARLEFLKRIYNAHKSGNYLEKKSGLAHPAEEMTDGQKELLRQERCGHEGW